MEVEVIVTVDGIGYKGIFNDIMTQQEILDQIVFAFQQLKLFPKENKVEIVEMEKPKEEDLQLLERAI